MNTRIIKKSLVVFVILLFIGVSLSSGICINTKPKLSKIPNEERRECRELSKAELFRVKGLLNRLEVYFKSLMVLSKYKPELRNLCQELSDLIDSVSNWNYPIFCFILEDIFCFLNDTISFILEIYEKVSYGGIIYRIAVSIGGIAYYISAYIVLPIALDLGCDWVTYPFEILIDNPN